MQRVEMHAKTKYSKDHESTIDIKNLILKCIENKEKGVAIVDSESIMSFLKAEKILKKLNIKDFKLIYGVELKVYYNDNAYKAVVLVKNKEGISSLYKELNVYNNHKKIPLSWIMMLRRNFVLGLIYEQNNYSDELLEYFDYVEVDNKVSKEEINNLKSKSCVVYSNKINALSDEEILAKKVLYNKLRIKQEVDNRVYQCTKEVLNEINDKEIVIDNPNKIFNMIEKFDIMSSSMNLPSNNDFDLELQVYLQLYEKYGINIPNNIKKRVDEEIKLIKEYNYEGFISIYKELSYKCKISKQGYSVLDYVNYLYIAYILDIIHFDPMKLDLNYELFFASNPKISMQTTNYMCEILRDFVKEKLNTVQGRSLIKLNGIMLENAVDKYEKQNNVNFSLEERVIISKYLDDYPISSNCFSLKEILFPQEKDKYVPTSKIINDRNETILYTDIDYKDIEDKFMIIEILPSSKHENIKKLKEKTNDNLMNCNYKDKKIINKKEYKDYLRLFEKSIILDDFYDDVINSDIELPIIFNIINEIKSKQMISKKTKDILIRNNIKIKKYHSISFISRGILNELVKIEYELLYFKEYHPEDYYEIVTKNDDLDKYFDNKLSIIGTRPLNGKMQYMSKLLCNFLDKNKNIILFGFGGPINYYLEYLLSEISNIDRKVIHQYLNPCTCYKDKVFDIDKEKYISSIKYLLNKNLNIKDYHMVNDSIIENSNSLIDKILYILNDNDVVIIDSIEAINNDLEKILKSITKIKNTTFIIFTNLKREYEETKKIEITSFNSYEKIDKYAGNIGILDNDKLSVIKEQL